MAALWFVLLCFMLAMFVVLDGRNLGAGSLHLIVAKDGRERREVIAAIGPLWSWHEVWLVAAGGTFVLAFPSIMAVSFSGFYLALWLVLWCFVLRGIAIEMGGHIHDALWRTAWDFVFAGSSVLLAALFGTALGNILRGVPLDQTGQFAMPLFTDFGVRGRVGILDWYTASVAAFTVAMLAAHGAAYLALKTTGDLNGRCGRWARRSWAAVAVLFPLVSLETWIVRPSLYAQIGRRPIAWIAVTALVIAAWAVWTGLRRRAERLAFAGSCAAIGSLLAGAAAGVFPEILHSTIAPEHSVTVYAGAAGGRGLGTALVWWPIAFVLAIMYLAVVAYSYRGKVRAGVDLYGE